MFMQNFIKLCIAVHELLCLRKQDNVQVNTESVQCISIPYSEVRITEISEQLSRVDQCG